MTAKGKNGLSLAEKCCASTEEESPHEIIHINYQPKFVSGKSLVVLRLVRITNTFGEVDKIL